MNLYLMDNQQKMEHVIPRSIEIRESHYFCSQTVIMGLAHQYYDRFMPGIHYCQ